MPARHPRNGLFGAMVALLHSTSIVAAQSSNSTTSLPTSTLATSIKPPTSTGTGASCTGTFTPVAAFSFVVNMNPGWNLGNTLDAVEDEGDWNNPPVVGSTFDDAKAAGFKGIRLPVTWAYHFTSQSPDWTVDPAWLQRVSDLVDMISSRGFHTIVNVHHDSWIWADITAANANITQIEERFYKLWLQIGTKLACKGSTVAFEPINEPPGTTAEHGAQQNKMNDIFLQAINDAGGFNPQRVVTLAGSSSDSVKTSLWFKRPDETKFKNPWALQYHYYSPYDFIFSAWGRTTWGSPEDKQTLSTELSLIRSNFTDVPLIIGEWAASPVATETAARWKYFDFFVRTAAQYNTTTVLWDNGADFLNRATHGWRDNTALDILRAVVKGEKNSLPESTTDGSATEQESSAYLYHKSGTNVSDTPLKFQFNGNRLQSAKLTKTGKELEKGTDYLVEEAKETVTFKSSFLSTILTPATAPGSVANITLVFSSGAPLLVNILQYSTPVLATSTSKLPAAPTALSDLHIPITWAGQNRPATVKAVKSDGKFLVDDWTQWLGPLQQGRMTYGGQWDWDGAGVIVKAAALEEVRRAGLETVFRIEFYPRREGNWVEYTVSV